MADDKFDELIQKQIERENKMKEVREDYSSGVQSSGTYLVCGASLLSEAFPAALVFAVTERGKRCALYSRTGQDAGCGDSEKESQGS